MDNLGTKLEKLKQNGRKLIGCFPLYPPVELFHSMDLEPIVIWGLKPFFPDTARSDRHLQNFTCSVCRHLVEFVLSGDGKLLDGLFMYNACDTLRNIPEVIQCGLEEEGRGLPILNIHIPMLPRGQMDTSSYMKTGVNSLIRELENRFDCSFTENRFRQSVDIYRSVRSLAGQLEQAVAAGKMSFGKFAGIMQGNYFRPVEEQVGLLTFALEEAEKPARADGNEPAVRIILSGILPPDTGICSQIEEAGLVVAGNDIASLRRTYFYTPGTVSSPAEYYTDFYLNHHPCTTLLGTADERVGVLEALAGERYTDGIIFIGEKFCEYEYFEFPYLKKYFNRIGIDTLLLEITINDDGDTAAYRTRIEAFAEMMHQRRQACSRN